MTKRGSFPFGPSPAEFRAAFKVGADDGKIHPVDACGVMLSSIQALHQLLLEQNHEIQALQKQIRALNKAIGKRG
jgi:hypothetical protein